MNAIIVSLITLIIVFKIIDNRHSCNATIVTTTEGFSNPSNLTTTPTTKLSLTTIFSTSSSSSSSTPFSPIETTITRPKISTTTIQSTTTFKETNTEYTTMETIKLQNNTLSPSSTSSIPPPSPPPYQPPPPLLLSPQQPPYNDHSPCPPLEGNFDTLTQVKFAKKLMNDCRYDRLTLPEADRPQVVYVQIDLKHIEAVDQLQFKTHMLVQYSYLDERLAYEKISPKRGTMVGEELFRDRIWIPHIVIGNERDTSIMGIQGNDVLVSISPQGHITYSYRMTAQIYCWMNLQKFPFDEQICDIIFKSWTHNASHLILKWEEHHPVRVATQLHLTEFTLVNHWTESETVAAKQAYNAVVGNFSILTFKFHISREVGYYVMDYFIPSIMLVCTSWVAFWLQADNAAPRVTLGTSTMLSFITLASGQTKTLPKVSYIKASEIWFLGCTIFIFASIAEFAFVNIIWRRNKKVELKKVNSKYILKSTLTPKLARKELRRSSSMTNLHKSHSFSSLNNNTPQNSYQNPTYNNYLTVHSFPSTVPIITTQDEEDVHGKDTSIPVADKQQLNDDEHWTTMTPQEIAIWIDKRSRIVFPCMFLIFNIFYWSFVYLL